MGKPQHSWYGKSSVASTPSQAANKMIPSPRAERERAHEGGKLLCLEIVRAAQFALTGTACIIRCSSLGLWLLTDNLLRDQAPDTASSASPTHVVKFAEERITRTVVAATPTQK